MNLVVERYLFCPFDSFFECLLIFNFLEWPVDSEFCLTLFIPSSFGSFGNIGDFWMFVLHKFWSRCILLNNEFKRIVVGNNQSVNIYNSIDKIRNEFFFLLTVFNNSMLFVLNEFFCYNYIDGKRSMIRQISNIRINAVIIDFHEVRIERE